MSESSKTSSFIADQVIDFYKKEFGYMPNTICAFGDPDMVYFVLEKTNYGNSKQNMKYGWGTRHRRGTARVNNALRQDSRFRECRVRGTRIMVGFDYLAND